MAAPKLSLKRAYEAGEQIAGKYMLHERLGEGGMGAVWRAHNETLDIDVAVKLIRAEETEASDGPQLSDRLLQEARAAARLGHPAIARVFDFGRSDRGDPFIVMELLEGEDLAEALSRRGRINASKAVATLMPIAHALAAAHAKGIVHRDLKPENIFLARGEDGHVQPKLVDFGIAKVDINKNHRLTQTGTMLGSPIYMSPEQARGDDVDHLADVWALCVVLYEMVTGRPPFEGKNYNALLYSIIADEPPPITSFSAGDDELWAILKRGFKKDPDKRWQSIRELGIELAKWLMARNIHEDITGASMSAQWLRRAEQGGDVLSVMPASHLRPTRSTLPDIRQAITRLSRSSWATRFSKRQLMGVAIASAFVGVLLVIFVASYEPSSSAAASGNKELPARAEATSATAAPVVAEQRSARPTTEAKSGAPVESAEDLSLPSQTTAAMTAAEANGIPDPKDPEPAATAPVLRDKPLKSVRDKRPKRRRSLDRKGRLKDPFSG